MHNVLGLAHGFIYPLEMHVATIYSRVIAEIIARVQNTRVAFFQLENSEAISVFHERHGRPMNAQQI